jgi:UDP-arabinose 4-epimerase
VAEFKNRNGRWKIHMSSQSTVLVTGGAGYIGSHTAKELALAGYRVVVYDNLSRGNRWAVRWGPFEEGDLQDQDRLRKVLTEYQVDAVLHFAAFAEVGESMRSPDIYFGNNVAGSLSLLNAMHVTGVRRIVFSSTCAIYGVPEVVPITEDNPKAPSSPYGESKLAVEKMLHWEGVCRGLQWMALRYFNAAGCDADGEIGESHDPETHLIPSLLNAALGRRPACPIFGGDYPTPDGTCIRDYIHVADLANAHVRALHHLESGGSSTALNLGTGDGYSVNQILAAAEAVTGRPIPVVRQDRRPGDPPRLVAAPQRAFSTLRWKPAHSSIENILETAWRWSSAKSAGAFPLGDRSRAFLPLPAGGRSPLQNSSFRLRTASGH